MSPVEMMARSNAEMFARLRAMPFTKEDIAYGKWLMESSIRDLDALLLRAPTEEDEDGAN